MTMTLAELRTLDAAKYPTPTKPIVEDPITAPSSFQVTGNTGYFVIQWAPIGGVTGYQIAVMTDKELDTPNIGIFTEYGSAAARHDYLVGNIALTRFFAVRAFRDVTYSAWTAIKSATSLLMTGVGIAEPTNPAPAVSSTPPIPSGGGHPGSYTCPIEGTQLVCLGGRPTWELLEETDWITIDAGLIKPLTASPSHVVYTNRGLCSLDKLTIGDMVVSTDGERSVVSIIKEHKTAKKMKVYVESGHLYFANGILSHNVKAINID